MVLIEKILELLQYQAESTIDLLTETLDSAFSTKPASYRKLYRAFSGTSRHSFHFKENWADLYRRRQRFYTLLNYLKRQGLIEKEVRERNSIWKITKSGRAKLKALKEKSLFSPATILYRKRSDTELKIIIFDIPEMERKKRTWLRQALRTLEFNMLQRSVWVGKKKIPKEFLRDLNERDLLPYVHVFAVNKTGTIRTVQ